MSKIRKDKQQNPQKSTPKAEDTSFEEKKRAAYSQMGQLGGLARAKQMAEQGFTSKTSGDSSNKNKAEKSSLEKGGKQNTSRNLVKKK